MALLLGVLAVLQYRWVGQLSADERERLRSHADNQAENLTEDFNRELTRAFFWLQVGPELRRDAPLEAEVDRYARWYSAAPRPEIVKTIYRLTEPTIGVRRLGRGAVLPRSRAAGRRVVAG